MTVYTFNPTASSGPAGWNDPTRWVGGVVPNAPDADVILPLTTVDAGEPAGPSVDIPSGLSFGIRSLSIVQYALLVDGALSVSGRLSIQGGQVDMQGGTLTIGSLDDAGSDIVGNGTLNGTGALTNDGTIIGRGLTISAPSFTNTNVLNGFLTLVTPGGGFTNLSGTTLSGGTYTTASGMGSDAALRLDVGAVVATDAATITLNDGAFESFDPASGTYQPLQATLRTVAAGGVLSVQTYATTTLAVEGTLELANDTVANAFTADQLTIAASGVVTGVGTLSAAITNDGIIQAAPIVDSSDFNTIPGDLVIDGDVTGSGALRVGAAYEITALHGGWKPARDWS